MPAFEYVALNAAGRNRKGVLEGDSARHIRQLLRERDLIPVEVEEIAKREQAKISRGGKRGARMSAPDLSLMLRQLATLVRSGIPLEEALLAVSQQTDKKNVQRIVIALRAKVMEGHTLADGLAEFPQAFEEMYRATIEAGEHSGNLHISLERLADYAESSQEIRQKTQLAMLYPIIVTLVAVAAVVGLTVYVVPQVVDTFKHLGEELPLLTRALIRFSDILKAHGLVILAVLAVLFFAVGWFFRQPGPRFALHSFYLRAPLIGRLTRGVNAARFARTLSILAASGVPILDGLKIASRVVSNLPMRAGVEEAAIRVREGTAIHKALAEQKLFPPMLVHLIANGEASGELETMLDRAADNQEREMSSTISALLGILGPVLILLMGGLVMMIVIAILLPIFNLNQLVA